MDIQEIESKFEELLLANPDFDESLLQKDEDGCYEDFDINSMYQMFEAGTEVGEKWQVAKAQAVPKGYVLVPKLLSYELADELASDAFNNIQSMFDYEHRGSTATHREQIRLRWCRNKARKFQENHKILIEAQEQSDA